MSTWTSSAALAGAFALAGCALSPSGSPPREVVVARGAIAVSAPPGYCVDPAALRDAEDGSFVLMASCASLDPRAEGPAALPAILTVTVSAADPELEPPRAAELAQATPVPAIATVQRGALALAHFAEGGDSILPGGDPRHWRGATGAGGRVIGLALYAPEGSPLAGEAGGQLVGAAAARIEARAPRRQSEESEERPRAGLGGALARLFN
jgi:hypothetical protein